MTLCLAMFAIGIAAGSLFAAQLSHVRPNLALVPIGAIVMGIVGLDLAWAIGHCHAGRRCHPLAVRTSFGGAAACCRLLRVRLRRRPVRGAVLCRRTGLVGAGRARPRHRRRQHPAGRLHGGGLAGRRAGCRLPGLPMAWIFFGLALATFGSVWFVLGEMGQGRRARFRRAVVSSAVSGRGTRTGKSAAAPAPAC